MKVILDTSAWYAYVNSSDEQNASACEFVFNKPEILVPFTVFEEFNALVFNRHGKSVALEFGEPLLELEMWHFSESEIKASWNLFESLNLKNVSFVDSTIAFLAKKLRLPVFTFDSHFKKIGCNVFPN